MDEIEPGTYTAAFVKGLKTISKGNCCDLKHDDGTHRVWLCRGAGGVTVETLQGGKWIKTSGGCDAPSAEVR